MQKINLVSSLVVGLSRSQRRTITAIFDAVVCVIATFAALILHLGGFPDISVEFAYLACISSLLILLLFTSMGLYKAILRHLEGQVVFAIGRAMGLYAVVYTTTIMGLDLPGIPRFFGVTQSLLLFFFVTCSRIGVRFFLGLPPGLSARQNGRSRALIYGAGSAGRQLAGALIGDCNMQVIGFVDDDHHLHGRLLNGHPIYPGDKLHEIINRKSVTHVLLAMPSISRAQRNAILRGLSKSCAVVRSVPSLRNMVEGHIDISDIRELDVEDLLARNPVAPDSALLSEKIEGKTVLVTGAGGSIGTELCRQIFSLKPKALLLIDISEFGTYSVFHELESMRESFVIGGEVKVIPLLCSVQDHDLISSILVAWKPDTVYHAAAYKHVSLVECNGIAAVKNNLFGTWILAEAAIRAGVSDFILISTDKAVRPTNVMGATKRLAEMLLQALNAREDSKTCLAMVRFGNVLASSGSVIPKFRSQIESGGPVTVTHPEVTRFFMTISEAAELVIQASALAKGGDVFVLDMGQPVKIMDLAKTMIRLSGLSVRSSQNPDGDIAITISGLSPGEKLYEELLIGDDPRVTKHPKIMKAKEKFISWSELYPDLEALNQAVSKNDSETTLKILTALVDGFVPEGGIVEELGEGTIV